MRQVVTLMIAAVGLAVTVPVAGQMMHAGDGMGGGRRSSVNLVSPAASQTQIRRGMLMIGSFMGMMGNSAMRGAMMPTPSPGNLTRGLRVMLRLYGVADSAGLVTSTRNHLLFNGRLTSATGDEQSITIDQEFNLTNGAALVQVPVTVADASSPATLLIDQVAVTDAAGDTFAAPGVMLVQPTPAATPQVTPGTGCTSDSDCNDGNPDTQDVCMPMGCRHMPDDDGPGMP
jgi:hypothetical protein